MFFDFNFKFSNKLNVQWKDQMFKLMKCTKFGSLTSGPKTIYWDKVIVAYGLSPFNGFNV